MGLGVNYFSAKKLRPFVQTCSRGRELAPFRVLIACLIDLLTIGAIRLHTSSSSRRVVGRLNCSDSCTSAGISTSHGKFEVPDKYVQLDQKLQQSHRDDYKFMQALKACSTTGDLAAGKMIHRQVLQCRLEYNSPITSALIGMYARCGSLEDAHRAFDSLPRKCSSSWTSLIVAYALQGDGWQAIRLFEQMQKEDNQPGKSTLVILLKVCSRLAALQQGELLHAYAIRCGLQTDVFIGSSLVDMYAKCGSLDDARKVFDQLLSKNLVTWNAMISGYAHHGNNHMALQLFEQMQKDALRMEKVLQLLSYSIAWDKREYNPTD